MRLHVCPFRAFYWPQWQISLRFHVPQLVKLPLFHIHKVWKILGEALILVTPSPRNSLTWYDVTPRVNKKFESRTGQSLTQLQRFDLPVWFTEQAPKVFSPCKFLSLISNMLSMIFQLFVNKVNDICAGLICKTSILVESSGDQISAFCAQTESLFTGHLK